MSSQFNPNFNHTDNSRKYEATNCIESLIEVPPPRRLSFVLKFGTVMQHRVGYTIHGGNRKLATDSPDSLRKDSACEMAIASVEETPRPQLDATSPHP